MDFFPAKIESEIIAIVKDIITHRITDFDKPPFREIVLICNSESLPPNFEASLNYTVMWIKMNLGIGDRIKFKAKVKKSTYFVHRTERWVDNWSTLPADMVDTEEEIEIKNVKQIMKI
ncbi:MAG TPA: hypothetical protein VL443_04530 [Cyclobacteriaceae bacterium]|jgi:hypothetical protein|nr:hypothetical protein [Cyclobacteriaceae bacterium]